MSVDRRGLLIGSVSLTASSISSSDAREGEGPAGTKPSEPASGGAAGLAIAVDDEFSALKEVIVGIPYFVYPDLSVAAWAAEALKVVPEEESAKMAALSGNDSVSTGIYDAMEKENEALIETLDAAWRQSFKTREADP